MARSQRYDDYDDADEPRPRSSSSGNKDLVQVLGIIGGVLLLIALVCGGVGFYVFYTVRKAASKMQESIAANVEKMQQEQQRTEAARELAQSFVDDLKDNQATVAYEATSANYQKKMSLEKFKALVKQRAKVIEQQLHLQPDPNTNPFGPNTVYRFTETILIHGEGSFNLVIAVISEGNQWKVDQFSITVNSANKNSP
jgi:hypothetical protein